MNVVVTGGTGFVGRRVVETLLERGDAVCIVTRDAARLPSTFHGLVETMSWDELDLSGKDAVVHLAGENIFAKRWSEDFKRRLRSSRVETTERVVEALAKAEPRPSVFVCASAIGIYGNQGEAELNEKSSAGNGLLAEIGQAWEAAARQAEEHGVRSVQLRIGVVLGEGGGALARMMGPFKAYLGGPVGGGKQWVSWVHVRDVARIVAFALDHEKAKGPINATAPEPVRMKELCSAFGKAIHRPSWMPVPGFALRLLYGPSAEVVLGSIRTRPSRLQELGFTFEFPQLQGAVEECLTELVVP
ncbi:MAG: TIGR01777 family protein [Planctomycetota bacterium]|nr:MAG: TIGR01777 family protein [Planctomycetota bacterium]